MGNQQKSAMFEKRLGSENVQVEATRDHLIAHIGEGENRRQIPVVVPRQLERQLLNTCPEALKRISECLSVNLWQGRCHISLRLLGGGCGSSQDKRGPHHLTIQSRKYLIPDDICDIQEKAGNYAHSILKSVEPYLNYKMLSDSIFNLRKIPLDQISDPLPILYDLIDAVCHQKAVELQSGFKLGILILIAAYSNLTYTKIVLQGFKIDTSKRKDMLIKLTRLKSLSSNDPLFMNLINYYILLAESVFQLINDNHKIDWLAHGANILQTATSFLGIGTSRIGEMGSDLARAIKEKITKFFALKKYEQILVIIWYANLIY
eukprot:TRINITY_DN6521_c0_g1_i4.p1 TRINITY_DN6521_c0_g1~~TRINITY_DN6521_c0_g1_i4.p1  ORF type:complete len:319 (+),score=20.36 TRINITY_DN6521_c0_g1_i4:69-1025(+)